MSDSPDAYLIATQLSRALGASEWIHSPTCETCRVAYPCGAIAAIEALDEPAVSFYRSGGWL